MGKYLRIGKRAFGNGDGNGPRKQEAIELVDFLTSFKTGTSYQDAWDVNHPLLTNWRLMADGSYRGEPYYRRVLERLKESGGNRRKLRSLAIEIMMDALSDDNTELSRSTIQRYVVQVFGSDLDRLNDMLVDDLIEMAEEHEIKWD